MLGTDGKSFRPIHPLPILTDTDSNRFLGLLTIPIPIFIYEYHTDTDTDFPKNTDIPIPIPIIPIIGLTLVALAENIATQPSLAGPWAELGKSNVNMDSKPLLVNVSIHHVCL